MKGLTQGNQSRRRASSCSFCGNEDHQATVCPHVPIIWAALQDARIPVEYISSQQSSNHYTPFRWMSNPHMWGDLYKHTEKANEKQVAYQLRKSNKTKSKTNRRSNKCGYCGEEGHTRRTCTEKASMIALLRKANKNYRQHVYDTLVSEQGLSDGALVSFRAQKESSYRGSDGYDKTITTLCTGVNWETINLFSDFVATKHSSWRIPESVGCGSDKLENIKMFLSSSIDLKVSSQGLLSEQAHQRVGGFVLISPNRKGLSTTSNASLGYYDRPKITDVRVVSRAPQVLSEDWVDGYSDEMSVIFTKFSSAQLDYIGAIKHIEEWANKTQ